MSLTMFATRTANEFYDACLTLLYPQPCAVCGSNVEHRRFGNSCERCWHETRLFESGNACCWKCGESSRALVANRDVESIRCHRCDAHTFTAARACGVYEGALRAAVLQLKREPNISNHLLKLLTNVQQRPPLSNATRIVPVPLHAKRQQSRGFNQASVIAAALRKKVRLPVDELSLVRVEHTERHRAGMDARDRRASVENAFAVVRPSLISGENILLIDDVFTTGATVSACAAVLFEAAAANVFVLTIARPVGLNYYQ